MVPPILGAQRGDAPGGVGQQQPPPKNLQVLPKDMSRQQVGALMRGSVAAGLGVRCEYCHVQTQGPDGRQVDDYAADDKETKKVAREMFKMVMDVNSKLKTIRPDITDRHQVTCETCHRGVAKPRTIQAEMADAAEAKGADSAVALYRDLRVKYYGREAYDFGEPGLLTAAQQISQLPNQRPAAIALLKVNLEYFPKSLPTYNELANQALAMNDTATAVDALTKALEVNPNDQRIQRRLQGLKRTP
jgi:tetratricopeptide (TPR) repeat protein